MSHPKPQENAQEKAPEKKEPEKPKCGIIMPISEIDGCSAAHWNEVLRIIKEALEGTEFTPELVSNANEAGVIQARIIKNLAENPIVICDVSGKNPNVMFELGMRLAFDLPTVVIKDNETGYSFDTSPIEHVEYPRGLTFFEIVEFKRLLASKVVETYAKAKNDKHYSSFLGYFVQYKPKTLPSEEIPAIQLVLKEVAQLKELIFNMPLRSDIPARSKPSIVASRTVILTLTGPMENRKQLFEEMILRNIKPATANRYDECDKLTFPFSEVPSVTMMRELATERGLTLTGEVT